MNFEPRTIDHPAFALVTAPAGARLGDIPRDYLLARLADRGAVLFRGFGGSLDEFSRLVETSSKSTAIDPAREFFAKNVQLVDAGTVAVGLHCENGNTPLLPDVVWFYCARAASRGSQTTLCDGTDVWDRLTAPTKWLFERFRVTYSRTVPEHLWSKYVRHQFKTLRDDEVLTQERIDALFANVPGVKVKLHDDRSLSLSVSLAMAHPSRFSERLTFANSLLGPSYNYEKPVITLEDGTPLPAWAMEDVEQVTDACTKDIPWESGDVIAIDNTRVMHGRREILDTDRKLYTALSFV